MARKTRPLSKRIARSSSLCVVERRCPAVSAHGALRSLLASFFAGALRSRSLSSLTGRSGFEHQPLSSARPGLRYAPQPSAEGTGRMGITGRRAGECERQMIQV